MRCNNRLDVLPYLLIGVVVDSAIYGFMPMGLLEQYAGSENPLAGGLLAKGAGAGTVLALIIGSAGASLAELILLRALFTFKLLAAFVAVILAMAIIAGYGAFLFF